MKNKEIAGIFHEIAEYLEAENMPFKPYAYRKAAITLETMEEDIEEIYGKKGLYGLKKIPNIGESMALKIEEYLKTGRMGYYEELKKKTPVNLGEMVAVEGLGPRKAKILYEKLGVRNIDELEKAAQKHDIARLSNFGDKTEENILAGISFMKENKGRYLLGEILPRAEEIRMKLEKLKEIEKIDICGSIRRRKETIGDVDFLAISDKPEKVADFFVKLPGIVKVRVKGTTKASVKTAEGFNMDIRIVPKESYGAALQYFTGSQSHNILLRKIAIDNGLKLSEYGLFEGRRRIRARDEKDIYEKLGLSWIEPELREGKEEIEFAMKGRLPELIAYDDLKGNLHTHSNWNGGENSIEELAKDAMRLGHSYIGISDHTKALKIENGLDEENLERQRKEIDSLNEKYVRKGIGFKILQGCESNILSDGSIDIADDSLAKLDFVIGGIHSQMRMSKEDMTRRMIRAMKNPNVDMISHPTGRILKRREAYEVDFEEILKVARDTGTILEINSFPERLDLNDVNIKRTIGAGVKMAINADAHQKDHLSFLKFGIAQARRGWAKKKDIVNAWPVEKLEAFFKN